jgi:predicted DNA-binding transcriptional regulator AlpA
VRERLALKADFPKAARINGGHPRWKRSEILQWMEQQKEKTGGRKRRQHNNQGAP